MKKILTLVALSCSAVLTALPARAETALPDTIAAHIATAPLEKLLSDVEGLVMEAVKGTPVQIYAMPGMLGMQLPMATGLPPKMLDTTKSVHACISNPTDKEKPLSAVLLPIQDFDNQIKLIGGFGFVKTDSGIYEKKQGAQKLYLGFLDKKAAIYGNSQADVTFGLKTFGGWKSPATPTNGIRLTVDIAKIMQVHGAKVEAAINGFKPAGTPGTPASADLLNLIEPIIKGAGKSLLLSLREIDTLTMNYLPSAAGLTISTELNPKAGSSLAKTGTALQGLTGIPTSFKYLPKDSAMAGYFNWNEGLYSAIEPLLKPIIEGMDNSTGSHVDISAAFNEMKKISGNNESYAIYSEPSSKRQVTVAYIENSQSAKYHKLITKVMPGLNAWLKSLFGTTTAPMTISLPWKQNAGEINGQKYDTLDVAITANPNGGSNPAMDKAFANSSSHSHFAFTDTAIISTSMQGSTALKAATKAAITAYQKKSIGLGAKKELLTAMQQSSDAYSVNAIYPLDFMKMALSQPGNQGSMGMPFMPMVIAAAAELPSSKTPLLLSANGSAKALAVELKLPAAAINEIIIAGTQAAAKVQMQQAQMGATIKPVKSARPMNTRPVLPAPPAMGK